MKATLGVDFGTLSARALIVDTATGRELGAGACDYAHGVLEKQLPSGQKLPPDWALCWPEDYWQSLIRAVQEALRGADIPPEAICAIGLDATSSTAFPVDGQGAPLCEQPRFRENPWAWMMLWKHHGATDQAERIRSVLEAQAPSLLARYGGRVSPEWLLPKMLQVLEEAPEVFDEAEAWMEAGNWIVARLTGERNASQAMAAYKAFYRPGIGWPDAALLKAIHPRLPEALEKLPRALLPMGRRAGCLTEDAARALGLPEGIPVAVANIDAHVSMPALGAAEPGTLLMIMGTSTCHILSGEREVPMPGISGVVADGVYPGAFGYEAGQSCCGDHFRWLIDNLLPARLKETARAEGLDDNAHLTCLAAALKPGESGLIALDWWNGNRSILADMSLSGLILGLTLNTRVEEIYRALMEATAYGARRILENFEENGLKVERVCACGGIARKNPLMMQIYADVLDREITVARSAQAPALGSAIFAATAAGRALGGWDDVESAARAMGGVEEKRYAPLPENAAVYEALYREYKGLHDCFGRGETVMHRLRRLRNEVRMG